jgi:hypothetical protein
MFLTARCSQIEIFFESVGVEKKRTMISLRRKVCWIRTLFVSEAAALAVYLYYISPCQEFTLVFRHTLVLRMNKIPMGKSLFELQLAEKFPFFGNFHEPQFRIAPFSFPRIGSPSPTDD